MKITKKTKLHFTLLLAISIFFIGCQKEGFKNISSEVTPLQIENAKKEIGRKIQANGYEQTFAVNKRLQSVFTDMRGDIVSSPVSTNLLSACGGNPSNYNDVGSYTRAYICGQGYQLSVEWKVSWDNSIVNEHPTNPANKTTCTFRVSVPGNVNAYNNVVSGASNVVITDLGSDPDYPGSNIYSVRATATTYLSPSIVNTSGAILRLGANFVADCPALAQVSITPTSVVGLGWDVQLGSDPCTRNDKAWFQPPGALGYRQIGVFGYDPLGVCPSYTAGASPSYQHVEYSLDNGVTWQGFSTNGSAFSNLNTYPFVYRVDYALSSTLAVGTYNIKIRYANVKLTSASIGTFPTSSNSCATGVWNTEMWTGESWPGIGVN